MTNKTKKIVMTSLVAAIYAVLTLVLGAISYGPIQFRIAEIMVLLAFIKKDYIWGLTIGCFLANVIGPYGAPDIVFGTTATFLSVYAIYLTGKVMKGKKYAILIASIWPTLINAVIIGFMLNIFVGMPLILSMIQVGFGEFVVITIIGVPLYKIIGKKYIKLLENAF
ncbi:citrulline cluster-linked gene [[Clostridium] sordellii]|uniref:QueT transporter family protein n=1 Tax=Paraclostridium sordellii TaxID=1505 RepID=UPI0005DAF576|nr:QueT transporter family protein [Paeniclostridium sordellii]MDU4414332.1 QueT transporter family protein [Paeniclostridium sordellii]MRZ29617.1 QueT transporter family protein [Paeniclostridium sordellii]MVO74266.1 QueT transporter family protein [Paeniclostridium sordellii]CEO34992.1 citrulline cluster-linked gene [[Clostridium] sordellii] [Paeniclostridium sordellii]CEP93113.1 citrulline cluster-linked gene [[Clostridium] sordellii] [Paeniclostridium sordellii]